ncbi:hypothetical protein Tco_0623304 [Tanacetum coccineum]
MLSSTTSCSQDHSILRRNNGGQDVDATQTFLVKESKAMLKVSKACLTQTHIFQPIVSGAHEGTGVKPGVLDVPTYRSDDEEEIPWKSSNEDDNDDIKDDDDDQGDDNDSERTVSDTEGDDFVHPKFTSHDTEERHDEEDKDKESFDPRRLEADFLEFKQTNQYATALSSIPNIVDNYLGSKLKESVDVAIQLKSDKLHEEAQLKRKLSNKHDATKQTNHQE